jgi:tetratricopeptide (TPR) repeat protein
MIVRDEERVLPECLRSLDGVVDELVVVDTGSTDRTPEIARDHGARLASFPWRGDFAAARNAALDLARGRWILYIDADERVRGGAGAGLEALLRDEELVALTVLFRPVTGFTRYRENRLFRNHPRLRFRGVMHESHLPAIAELLAEEGGRVGHSELALDHVGYDGDLAHKHRRNLPLLRARLAADPGHVYSWTHLGHTLAGLGRREEAVAAWRRGIDVVRERGASTSLDSLPYLALLEAGGAEGEETDALLEEAWKRFPSNPGIAWRRGRALLLAGRPAEAIPLFERLAAVDGETYTAGLIAHDQRLFRVWAHDALGLAWFRLGRYRESARHYRRAEAAEPALDRAARRRLAEARAAAGCH